MNEDPRDLNRTLDGRVVWIIDDEFLKVLSRPELSHLRDDEMMEGTRPIDRGTLKGLLGFDDWSDANVKALCEQCIRTAADVVAFTEPGSAILHLKEGSFAPDVIVFDLMYDHLPTGIQPLAQLEELLRRCASLVQVYSGHVDDFNGELGSLQSRFSARLQSPVGKGQITAEQLATALEDRLARSLSTQLSRNVRKSTSAAVEHVLARIDDLPMDVAVKLLTGVGDAPDDVELVELISTKVGDAVRASSALIEAVNEHASNLRMPQELASAFADEVVDLLASNVRERIQYDGWLLGAIRSARSTSTQSRSPKSNELERTQEIIREFFSFRLYDRPSDSLVRTGDVVSISSDESLNDDPPELHLIVTPACDLVHFWKKTRGNLTMIRMRPATNDRVKVHLTSYKNSKPNQVNSVTSQNPLVFASLPFNMDVFADYLLFAHEIRCLTVDGTNLWHSGLDKSKEEVYGSPLTYEQLESMGQHVRRVCRVSEPFLSGVLSAIRNTLFRTGVPDYPDEEKQRIKRVF